MGTWVGSIEKSRIRFRGQSFLSPDTRSECFLRGAKFLAKILKGSENNPGNFKGCKFLVPEKEK